MLKTHPKLEFNLRLLLGYLTFIFFTVLIGEALVVRTWGNFTRIEYFLFPILLCSLCLFAFIIKVGHLETEIINKYHKGMLIFLLFFLSILGSTISISSIVEINKVFLSENTPIPTTVVFLGTLPLASIIFLAIFIDQETESGKMPPPLRMAVAASAICSAPMLFGATFVTGILQIKEFRYDLLVIILEILIVFVLLDHLKHIAYLSRTNINYNILARKFRLWLTWIICYLLLSPLTIILALDHNALLKISLWVVVLAIFMCCIFYSNKRGKFTKFRTISEVGQFSLLFLLLITAFQNKSFELNKIVLTLKEIVVAQPNFIRILGVIVTITIGGLNILVKKPVIRQKKERKKISITLLIGSILYSTFALLLYIWLQEYKILSMAIIYCSLALIFAVVNIIYAIPLTFFFKKQ